MFQNSGADCGQTSVGSLPNIIGDLYGVVSINGNVGGNAFSGSALTNALIRTDSASCWQGDRNFNASRYSSIYQDSATKVFPSFCSNKFIIKY